MKNSDPSTFERILIRAPNWLGDLMMSTAFLQAVLHLFPKSRIDLVVRKGFERIPLPHRGEILAFDKNRDSVPGFAKVLKQRHYDAAFVLPPSFSSAMMVFLAGIPYRAGIKGEGRSLLLKPAVKLSKEPRTRHLLQEYFELLPGKPDPSDFSPKLPLNEPWVNKQLDELDLELPENFCVLAPGAEYGPAKQWPVESYAELARLLVEGNQAVVVLGTGKDYEQGQIIQAGREKVHNFCGKTSLLQMIALLAKAGLLVSNDSGAMHVMAALGKKQVAIFGSTSDVWTGPLNPKAEILHLRMPCSPCYQRTCKYGHYDCLKKISPEEVFEKIALLSQRKS